MTTTKKPIDWERIELDYRAGILSVREISEARGISHTAINKKAKQLGWERDLKAKIKAKADALVSKAEVSKEVSTQRLETEKAVIDSNAQVIADIRLGHRKDINRFRSLANKMLDELEGVTDGQAEIKELIKTLKDGDLEDGEAMSTTLELAARVSSLPSRSKVMKEMSDTLKTLITLERDAYDIVTATKVDVTTTDTTPRGGLDDFYATNP